MNTLLDTMTRFRVRITDGDAIWTYCESRSAPTDSNLNDLRDRIKNPDVKYTVWAEVMLADEWIKVPEKNPLLIG